MEEIEGKKVEKFVKEIMTIERRFSTDQKGQKSNRVSELRDCVDRFIIKELNDENK